MVISHLKGFFFWLTDFYDAKPCIVYLGPGGYITVSYFYHEKEGSILTTEKGGTKFVKESIDEIINILNHYNEARAE